MRLNNVFYGFTKNGERKLLWKKYVTEPTSMGDVARTVYYDLETNVYIDPVNIDVDTLVPIVKMVGDVHRMSRRRVKKVFKADNEMLFDATGAFYGNIIHKTTVGKVLGNSDSMGSGSLYRNRPIETNKLENVLMARIDDSEGRVQNVKTNVLYPWSDRITEGLAVREVRPINTENLGTIVTKKKLLELDYRKEL